jgi:ABC-type branched-subunit amino acid transport system substrate-binding protein
MTRTQRAFLLAACFWLTSWQSAFAESSPDRQRLGVTDKEIVLGACAPLSGQQKVRGVPVVEGGRAYFDYINDQGGVNGRKIKLVACDDHYNVDNGAITCFDSCLKGKVFLGTLFQGTSSASRYVAMSDVNHTPLVGFSTGGDFIVHPMHPFVFQVRASYVDEATKLVDVLWNRLQVKRVALVYQDDAYGVTCRNAILSALSKHGASLIGQASYPRLSRNIEPLVSEIKPTDPEVVVIAGAGDAVSLIAKSRKEFGKNVRLVAFSSTSDLLTDEAGAAADGIIVSQVLPLADKSLPGVQQYKKILAKYSKARPSFSSFEGYLIAMAVVEGLKRAGRDLTRDGFVKALESINEQDVGLGKEFMLSFSPTNHAGLKGKVHLTVIKNGEVAPIGDWDRFKHDSIANRP